ncbi:MAG: 2-iminoacetate synthase ThiH [Bacteroides sp.]|nr:2-iminoacetate synthase ThiH [Ruminococcus flavefaciens]MCM1554316.1 2-iminoacetate synthase ThiH [Bacteroides sp.]
MVFSEVLKDYNWDEIGKSIYAKTERDVERALVKAQTPGRELDLEDFKALVSPVASRPVYLETMAGLSRTATQKKFGKTIQFYIPLYLSNECTNHCIYCGFNHENKFHRVTLTDAQIMEECAVLKKMGYEHILLLTGESPKIAGIDYLEHAMQLVAPHFAQISLEVQPMDTPDYARLRKSGLHAVYVYQETYNKERYGFYHPAGMKRDYAWRLNSQDRLGAANVNKIGLGALLGLEDWRIEAFCMALHLKHLQKTYWRSKYCVAFPRMRPHEGEGFQPQHVVGDREFAQMIWAFRLLDDDVEMSLTTRESPEFRNHMVSLGITSISAGSQTDPGGYAHPDTETAQFATNDTRSPEEMKKMIEAQGYEVVWKDWDKVYDAK